MTNTRTSPRCVHVLHVMLSALALVPFVPPTNALADADTATQHHGSEQSDDSTMGNKVVQDLVVEGNLIVKGDLLVMGRTFVQGALTAQGHMNVHTDLIVGGKLKASADMFASGDLYAQGSLHVSGASNTLGHMLVGGSTQVGGRLQSAGDVSTGGSLQSGGEIKVRGAVSVGNGLSAGGHLNVNGPVGVLGDVKAGEDLYVDGDLYVQGKIHNPSAEDMGRDATEDARTFCESVTPGSLQVEDCMKNVLTQKASEGLNEVHFRPQGERKHARTPGAAFKRISSAAKPALLLVSEKLAASVAQIFGARDGEEMESEESSVLSDDDEEAFLMSGEESVHIVASSEGPLQNSIPADLTPCKKDLDRFCKRIVKMGSAMGLESNQGYALECLAMSKASITEPSCAELVFQAQRAAALDYRNSAELAVVCDADAERLCAGVQHGGGRVNACLREHSTELDFDCATALFLKEVQAAGDIRLHVHAADACAVELSTFCGSAKPDNNEALLCLEDNRHAADFSVECKEEIERLIEAQSQDYRLDASLRRDCELEAMEACSYQLNAQTELQSTDSFVVECLQDYVMYGGESADAASPSCAKAVARTLSRKSEDIRFSGYMAQACKEDRDTFCAKAIPGNARVINCLDSHSESLTRECAVALFDHKSRMSENLEFNKPLRDACAAEYKRYCANVATGGVTSTSSANSSIRCLQKHSSRAKYSSKCKQELQTLEVGMLTEHRLNAHLYSTCAEDAMSLWHTDECMGVKQSLGPGLGGGLGGTMLHCLIAQKNQIRKSDCKLEVEYRAELQDWMASDD